MFSLGRQRKSEYSPEYLLLVMPKLDDAEKSEQLLLPTFCCTCICMKQLCYG